MTLRGREHQMKVEYRVKEVKRYVVTRWYEGDRCGGCETKGEFDNSDTAYAVGYALAKNEHEQLGYPVGDERIIYPQPIGLGLVEPTVSVAR